MNTQRELPGVRLLIAGVGLLVVLLDAWFPFFLKFGQLSEGVADSHSCGRGGVRSRLRQSLFRLRKEIQSMKALNRACQPKPGVPLAACSASPARRSCAHR